MPDDRVHAILPPPDLHRFLEVTGVGDADLEVSFAGWSKLAVLTDERVFLFPRWGRDALLLHGARVCEAVGALGVPYVPRVLGTWPEGTLSVGPFVAYERRTGISWEHLENDAGLDQVERMLHSLGRAIATWHRIGVADLPADLQRDGGFAPKQSWLRDFLDPERASAAVDEAARLIGGTPAWSSIWQNAIDELSRMSPVLVHGDVCENQLLVDADGRVTTVIDWDTAGIGHPLHDFDFGEWGFGIFAWEARFAQLRRAMWEGYRAERPDADLPAVEKVHLLFTLSELAYFEQSLVEGPVDEWGRSRLALNREAIGPATDAVAASEPLSSRG